MPQYTKTFLNDCLDHCGNNEIDVLKSEKCLCANCRNVFSARDVVDWDIYEGNSYALCPRCGFGLVIGDVRCGEITNQFITRVCKVRAERSCADDFTMSMHRFCELYDSFSISESLTNTELFVGYALGLSSGMQDDRWVYAALRIIAYGKGEFKAKPSVAIKLIEDNYNDYPNCLSLLGLLYYNHLGEGSERSQDQKALRYTKEAALLGDLSSVAFLSSLYIDGVGTKKNENMSLAVMENHLDKALNATLDPRPVADLSGAAVYFSHYAGVISLYDEKQGHDQNYRDLLRYYLLARQCFEIVGISEKDEVYLELIRHIEEAGKEFAPDGFDPELAYDAHSFYDTFVDFRQGFVTFHVESAFYDSREKTLRIVLSPFHHFILVDTSSCQTRIISKERVEFFFEGVISSNLPNGDFVFTGFFAANDNMLVWQIVDGCTAVGEIAFDPLYMGDED